MKKIKKAFLSLCKAVYIFVDKFIVTPISKIVYIIGNKITKGNKIDKILNKPNVLVYVSLALAIIVFYLVDSKVITLVQTNSEILSNQPINVIYNKSAYVVEGIPDSVDIILTGRKSDLYLSKQLGEHEVVLDLSDYEVSDEPQRVKLTYKKNIDSISYKLDPSYVTVTIKKKVSDIKAITYDLMNQDQLDEKLSVKSVTLSKNEVVVKGSEDTLNEIASVKALIDLSDKTFTEKGTYSVDNVNLVAYDGSGKILDYVEIVSTSISAEIVLDSYSKEVPINVLTTGNLVAGKAISSITINDKSDYRVTIYGEQSVLDEIKSVPVTIDVSNQGNSGEKTYNVTISKPSGVRHISESSASIKLNFGEAKQRTINDVTVEIRNKPEGLEANAMSSNDDKVDVQVIGVQSVIDNISADDITAYIDLTGYTVGEHTVTVQVEGTDSKVQYIVTKSINIVISQSK